MTTDRLRGWVAAAWIVACIPFMLLMDGAVQRSQRSDEQYLRRKLHRELRALAERNSR